LAKEVPVSTWTVVYERTSTGWSAYVPALPGVGVAAANREEAEELVSGAIALHLDGLAADGLPIPEPESIAIGQVELRLPA
jgi:predicted RNase H-like HicB family nuclease